MDVTLDVTVVGSGANGLTAAVIYARAGLKLPVVEVRVTFGDLARTAADMEFAGISHGMCAAAHSLTRPTPGFPLRGAGVHRAACHHAARTLLRREFGITGMPRLAP